MSRRLWRALRTIRLQVLSLALAGLLVLLENGEELLDGRVGNLLHHRPGAPRGYALSRASAVGAVSHLISYPRQPSKRSFPQSLPLSLTK